MPNRTHAGILPWIAWGFMSVTLALPASRHIDWSHRWLWKAALLITLAPLAALLVLLLMSVIGCGVIILFERAVLGRR